MMFALGLEVCKNEVVTLYFPRLSRKSMGERVFQVNSLVGTVRSDGPNAC